MKDLFIYLCNFSVVTSIAIVITVVLRPVLKKGPSFIRCALLTLIFMRLLIPIELWDMPFSIPNVFKAEESITISDGNEIKEENNSAQQTPHISVQTPIGGTVANTQKPVSNPVTVAPSKKEEIQTENPPITEMEVATESTSPLDVVKSLSVIWMAGMSLMLGYMLISNLVLKYKVKDAVIYDSHTRILGKDCSPFVFGFFRPVIYIPASIDKRDWEHIIAHESSHIKRLDHIVKPLAFLALCVYWYNPLVWIAYILLSKDIEYACDERTVKPMASEDKKAYSMALLAVSQQRGRIFAPLSFGEVNVKERIKRVMKFKNTIWAIALTAVICISLIAFIACNPATDEAAESYDNESYEASAESSEDIVTSETSEDESSADLETREETESFKIWADYVPEEEAGVTPTFVDDGLNVEYIKIWVNKPVKDFKYISVLYDEITANPYAGETLWETDELTPDAPFYVKSYVFEALSQKGISYKNELGETEYLRMDYLFADDVTTKDSLYLTYISKEPVVDTIKGFVSALNSGAKDKYAPYMTPFLRGETTQDPFVAEPEDLTVFHGKLNESSVKNITGLNTATARDYNQYTPYSVEIEVLDKNGLYVKKVFNVMIVNIKSKQLIGGFHLSAQELEYTYVPISPDDFFTPEQDKQIWEAAVEYLTAISAGDRVKLQSLKADGKIWDLEEYALGRMHLGNTIKLAPLSLAPHFESDEAKLYLFAIPFHLFGDSGSTNAEQTPVYRAERYNIEIVVFNDGNFRINGVGIEE